MTILVTGTLGYIGLYLCKELYEKMKVIMIDNLLIHPIENLQCLNVSSPIFYPIDIRN